MTATVSEQGVHQVLRVFTPSEIATFLDARSPLTTSSGAVPHGV
ncbi:hypothetical protein M2271_006967 [Streptomyces sp. LBL]|nr:hypothetical protein [Streptomyces sp. LBL]MDH6629131.1 hypothetical protein [Streptomyces sp. LBL]